MTEAESQRIGEHHVFEQWFKTEFGKPSVRRPSTKSVNQLYRDFLSELYEFIQGEFPPQKLLGKDWSQVTVHFLFSVPATWKDTALIAEYKKIITDAGFGRIAGHEVTVSLTEPEAVAAFTAKEETIFEDNDNVLVVDIGGGTADLCLLHINDSNKDKIDLAHLDPVIGDDVGATYIDAGFQDLAAARLAELGFPLSKPIEDVAWEMMMSYDFQNVKRDLGREHYTSSEKFYVKIPGLGGARTVGFQWGELKQIFDIQIVKVLEYINEVLDSMETALAKQQGRKIYLNHLILSGGLADSKYVQQQIQGRLDKNREVLKDFQFHVSTSPQLAVCKGLLVSQMQKIATTVPMISRRCCRSSYGVSFNQRYTRKWYKRHTKFQREAKKTGRVKQNAADNKMWIQNCMDWFVRRGKPVTENQRVVYDYRMRFDPGEDPASRIRTVQIYRSSANEPPQWGDKNVVFEQATLRCDFRSVDRSRMMVEGKNLYFVFEIEATVGATEVSFQCRDKVTRELLGEPVPIAVEYENLASEAVKTGALLAT